MNGNSLLRISDLSKNEIMEILDEANDFGSRYMNWQLPEDKLMLCSKPDATKSHMGKNIARIFPATSPAPKAIQTARQTSQLQSIPIKKAFSKVRAVL